MGSASDGQYDVNIERDGSMKVTSEEGETVNINTGKSATLPDKWPSSVPIISGAEIKYSATVGDGEGGANATVTYETSKEVSDVIQFYKEELIDNNWTIEATIDTCDGSMLTATNESEEGVMVNVGESDRVTTVVFQSNQPSNELAL